jgi:hypothetical protein
MRAIIKILWDGTCSLSRENPNEFDLDGKDATIGIGANTKKTGLESEALQSRFL